MPFGFGEERAYLFGALEGDGCLSNKIQKTRHKLSNGEVREYKRQRSRVCFCSKDKEFMDKIRLIIGQLYGAEPAVWISDELHYMETSNKKLIDDFTTFKSGTLTNLLIKEQCAFLRGFYDAEGCIHLVKLKYTRIILGNTNINLMKTIKEILAILDIKNYARTYTPLRNGKRCKEFYEIVIARQEDVNKFKDVIGFSLTRKSEKLRLIHINKVNEVKQIRIIKPKNKDKIRSLTKAESIAETLIMIVRGCN